MYTLYSRCILYKMYEMYMLYSCIAYTIPCHSVWVLYSALYSLYIKLFIQRAVQQAQPQPWPSMLRRATSGPSGLC